MVPPGSYPGQTIHVALPDGRMIGAQVPPNVQAGQSFYVQQPPNMSYNNSNFDAHLTQETLNAAPVKPPQQRQSPIPLAQALEVNGNAVSSQNDESLSPLPYRQDAYTNYTTQQQNVAYGQSYQLQGFQQQPYQQAYAPHGYAQVYNQMPQQGTPYNNFQQGGRAFGNGFPQQRQSYSTQQRNGGGGAMDYIMPAVGAAALAAAGFATYEHFHNQNGGYNDDGGGGGDISDYGGDDGGGYADY